MQFKLHINGTNDGSKIAADLRRLADIVDGYPLNNGFTRTTLEPGYATMEINDTDRIGADGYAIKDDDAPAG